MSTVFVARDNALGRSVVIKVLPYELAATVSVDRFKREIMLSAALQHPHIVPVLSAGETAPDEAGAPAMRLPFFIMPFVDGESLRTRLARGPLSVREAVSILKDVTRALAYAHGRGIIHRDIKPDNILLSSGAATVTDFGVAKAISASRESGTPKSATSTGTITLVGTSIGTPAYMAPEQAAGDPATDHRADLYALGIVGYEMLVGTPPFHGRAPQQLLAAQLTEKPAPIATRRYDVPEALASLLMRLLEKDPAKRPKTAAEVTRALEDPAVVSGTFVSAAAPKVQKPRRVLWALAGAGILASVAAGGAWFSNRHMPGVSTNGIAAAPVVRREVAGGDATRQHQPRHERRVLRRRNDGRADERVEPDSRIARRQRDGRREARSGRESDRRRQNVGHDDGARRNGAARQDAPARHGASREHRRRIHRLVRHVRARLEGRFPRAGRDLVGDRCCDLTGADVGWCLDTRLRLQARHRADTDGCSEQPRHDQSRGVRSVSARPLLL